MLDVTLNTDFAQVEADDEQINLTRFSLFFPEKRTFFQERADLFRFRLPGKLQLLFHSRTIGIVEGKSVPIIDGVRLTGRMRNWELGFMEMQTAETDVEGEKIASENFGVLRLKRQLKSDGSYIGGMITSRTDFKGNYNFLIAADADIRLKGLHYFKFHLARSVEPGSDPTKSLMGALILHSLVQRGFIYGLTAMHIGREFNPRMGFLFRVGINRIAGRVGYTWFPEKSGSIQNHGFTNTV
ncbi:MAG: hypothetical protein GTN76_15370, partial [Candidatus Aenigmarchaeota archaeon]|nr:hypothetical protein [Candidatus Aenigmarchaeota archaeon]